MALSMDDGDWVPLFRKIRDNWVWKDSDNLKAWLDLVMLANHHDGVFRFRGNIHHIKRGQVATTFLSFSKRNRWSRDRVKGFFNRLVQTDMIVVTHRNFDTKTDTWIDTKTDSGFILLTLINYPVKGGNGLKSAAESAAESTAESSGSRQGLHRDSTGTRHIQEGEEGKERKKGEKERAAAPALPAPAAALPTDRKSVVARLLEEVDAMTAAAAQRSLEMDDVLYRGSHPYPEVEEAKRRKASTGKVKTP